MRFLTVVFLFLLTSSLAYAQEGERVPTFIDSLASSQQKELKIHAVDSLITSIDSLAMKKQLDSIQTTFTAFQDSLAHIQQNVLITYQDQHSQLQHTLDSLQSLSLPTEQVQHQLDSVQQQVGQQLQSLNEKLQEKQTKVKEGLAKIPKVPGMEDKLAKASQQVENTSLPKLPEGLSIPKVGLGDGASLSELPNLSTIENPIGALPEVGALPSLQGLTEVNSLEDVTQMAEKSLGGIEQLKELPGGEYVEQAKALQNINDGESLDALVDKHAGNIEGLSDLQVGEDLQQLKNLTDEEAAKAFLEAQVKEQLKAKLRKPVNHFAGKEQVLQKAMQDMTKLKQKYESLNCLEDIKKMRWYNDLHDKSFIERLRPSIGLQVIRAHEVYGTDVNPMLGYRITSKLTAGAGWNERVQYHYKDHKFVSQNRVYGPRVYTEYKALRGFYPRFELETMNAPTPRLQPQPQEPVKREWVWSFMFGLKNSYRITKTLYGTSMVMGNLYDPKGNSPYNDRIQMRIGVEWHLSEIKN